MTRSRAIFAFALTAAMLGASLGVRPTGEPARCAGRRHGGRARHGWSLGRTGLAGLRLLTNSEVQMDLRLTDEQRVQILTLSMELRANRETQEQKLADILTPEQLRRLRQIRLQVEGPAALNSPKMVKALNLSPEQCAKLRALQDQVREKVQELVKETKGLSTEERRAKMPEILGKLDNAKRDHRTSHRGAHPRAAGEVREDAGRQDRSGHPAAPRQEAVAQETTCQRGTNPRKPRAGQLVAVRKNRGSPPSLLSVRVVHLY